jgi:hypothetical protein
MSDIDLASDNGSYVTNLSILNVQPILDIQAKQPRPDTNDSRCRTETIF